MVKRRLDSFDISMTGLIIVLESLTWVSLNFSMSDLIIDGNGTVMPAAEAIMRQNYGHSARSKSLLDFLVRNMGYVRVKISQSGVSIVAAPGRMKFRTYSAVAGLLDKLCPPRISLSWFDDEWQHKIFAGAQPVCHQLFGLMRSGKGRTSRRYISEQRVLGTLPKTSPLQAILQCWGEASGRLNVADCPELFHNRLSSKFSGGRYDPGSGRLLLDDLGPGITCWSPGTQAQMVDMPVEEMPDLAYGQAIASDWRLALLKREPTLVDVDAFVLDPVQKRTTRFQYTRLMLPISAGVFPTQRLLCASLVDRSVDFHGSSLGLHTQH